MDLFQQISAALPQLSLLAEEPLSKHCSFRVGGPAEVFAQPASVQELTALLRLCQTLGVRPVLLGAGTNVVCPDEGLRGVVICTKENLSGLRQLSETEIEAECGVTLARLAGFARALEQYLRVLQFELMQQLAVFLYLLLIVMYQIYKAGFGLHVRGLLQHRRPSYLII